MSKFHINISSAGDESQKPQQIINQNAKVIRNIDQAENLHIGDVIYQTNGSPQENSSQSNDAQSNNTSTPEDEDYKNWKQELRKHIAKQDPEKVRKAKFW